MVSQSLKADLMKAHKAKNDEKKNFVVVRLTKAGVPSKMFDAIQRFYYEHEAVDYVNRIRTLNPTQTCRFTLNGIEI